MKTNLLLRALSKFLSGLLAMGLLLFLPAGTVRWQQAWLLLGTLFIPMLILGLVLFVRAPGLLEKRLTSREKERTQKQVIVLSALMFAGGLIVSALDFRFGASHLPLWASLAAAAVFLIGYALYAEVMRENAYLSRTVEVQEHQKVIDTGLYGILRHPMYAATLLLFLSIPFVLGSLWAVPIFLVYPFLLVKRIRSEEAVLCQGLEGYSAYMQKVKYRLIPFVW